MLVVDHVVAVIEEKCIGCKACDRVCPTGAIVTTDKLAKVDASACTGCNKCLEACLDHGAIKRVFLDEHVVLSVDESGHSNEDIDNLCKQARLVPDVSICPCTGTTAREVAVAILNGAKSPDEISVQTGVRGVCSMWCTAPVLRMLEASGIEVVGDRKNWRLYPDGTPNQVSIWGITDEVAEKYPEYRLKESRDALVSEDLMMPMFPTIRGEK